MSTKISPELRAQRLAALEKARAVLAERRKARASEAMKTIHPNPSLDVLAIARELGELYAVRSEVEVEIQALEARLIGGSVPLAEKPKRTYRRAMQKPSLDLLEVFGEPGTLYTREEILEGMRTYHQGKYSESAITSTLRRLEKRGYLRFNEGLWTRTTKKVR